MKIKRLGLCMLLLMCFLLLGSCVREERIDYSELERRMVRYDERFAFDYDSLFFSDAAFYIPCSLMTDKDAMLILQTDGDRYITGVKAAVTKDDLTDAMLPVFAEFCRALTFGFVPEETAALLYRDAGVDTLTADYPIDIVTHTVKRYSATLFTDDTGVCFCVERR